MSTRDENKGLWFLDPGLHGRPSLAIVCQAFECLNMVSEVIT